MKTEQRERIYQARRAAHVARLEDRGMTSAAVQLAVAAWEQEAEAHGLPRDAPTFWAEGEAWITERRWH